MPLKAAAGGLLTKETRQEVKTSRRKEEQRAAVAGRIGGWGESGSCQGEKKEKAVRLVLGRERAACILGGGGNLCVHGCQGGPEFMLGVV